MTKALLRNYKKVVITGFSILIFLAFSYSSFAHEQASTLNKQTHIIGTKIAKPFAMKDKDGKWYGISIELWEKIAKELDIEFVVKDKAEQSDTVKVKARFMKEVEKPLEYFVNYPNPFNPEEFGTTFQFNSGNSNNFTLRVFDVSGMLVALEKIDISSSSGNYVNVPWDGKGVTGNLLPDGVYYALITSNSEKSKVVKILIYRKQ